VPPEAAVVALARGDAAAAAPGSGGPSYEALAGAEAAGEQAAPSPAELRVPPAPEPALEIPGDAHVPPEAAGRSSAPRNPTA
jgi:hypothetical protein